MNSHPHWLVDFYVWKTNYASGLKILSFNFRLGRRSAKPTKMFKEYTKKQSKLYKETYDNNPEMTSYEVCLAMPFALPSVVKFGRSIEIRLVLKWGHVDYTGWERIKLHWIYTKAKTLDFASKFKDLS